MEVNAAKAVSMLALGLGSFATGMLPACVSESTRQKHPLIISNLLCFGAGVLLATSLTHMLPEAREDLPEYAELMLCIGFFIVYLIDEMVHFFHTTQNHDHSRHDYGSGERTRLLPEEDMDDGCKEDNPAMCHVGHKEPCQKSSSGIIGLLTALLVHSVLEGLAIGLQQTSSQVLLLLGAVSAHKYVVGFCLGAEQCATAPGRTCAHIIVIALFSAGSVIGIGIGAGLESVDTVKESITVPIMQSLAAGTLLYVTVSEVMPRERARWHERKRGAGLAQFTSLVGGFVLMYLLSLFFGE